MLIHRDYSIIPACDVDEAGLHRLVEVTANLEGIGAYKLGFVLGLSLGLPKAVQIIRQYSDKPIIYDHQKAGTDIPDTGKAFAKVCKQAGLQSVIFFPQAGPKTEEAWIKAAQDEGLHVIVGGIMTHKAYVASDGGWLQDESVRNIYQVAAANGVRDFVVPGNQPHVIREIRNMLVAAGVEPIFYSPGLGAQGGEIAKTLEAAGKSWHPIVGRAIYEAQDMRAAAEAQIQLLPQH